MVWHQNKVGLSELVSETNSGLERAASSIILSLGGLLLLAGFFLLLHAVSQALLLKTTFSEPTQNSIMLLVIISSGIVALFTALNFLVVPFLSIGSCITPREAMVAAPFVIKSKRLTFLGLLLMGICLLPAVHIQFHSYSFNLGEISLPEGICLAFITWYILGSISVFCMSSAKCLSNQHVQALKNSTHSN